MSSIALLLLLGSFALPVFAIYHSVDPSVIRGDDSRTSRLLFYIATYLFYVVGYTVMMFFNSALISVALKRLDGESAGVRDGLQAAVENLPAIVGYALIAATVGTILRAIEERVGFIGRIVISIIGAGWTLATAMTLPVLIEEGVGPVDAISRSLMLLKRNCGKNLIGNVGISLRNRRDSAIPVFLAALFIMFSAISAGTAASDCHRCDVVCVHADHHQPGQHDLAHHIHRGLVPLCHRCQAERGHRWGIAGGSLSDEVTQGPRPSGTRSWLHSRYHPGRGSGRL